jgi:predicted TPR repeat methyltransferase
MAPPAELDRATELLFEGRFSRAMEACREVLARDPDNLEAEHLLARVLCESGRPSIAVMALQHVVARGPREARFQRTLGRAHRLAGDLANAEDALERALELEPDSLTARLELGEARRPHGLHDFETAVRDHPEEPLAHLGLAEALLDAGRLMDARAAFARAVELEPAATGRHLAVAMWHWRLGDEAAARRALEVGLALQPDDPELRHLIRAADGDGSETRASDAYLVRYFDRLSEGFDGWLAQLDYRTPEMLTAMLGRRLGDADGSMDILDAGCGTGLCGPLLRPWARRLVGVDISPGMLARASRLGPFDELVEAELTSFLERESNRFDVIVAADVFIYFGDLREILRLMSAALEPGGLLAFSTELHAGEGRELRASGRWAHSRAELTMAAQAADLDIELREADLRLEFGRPIRGLLALGARRP